MEMELGNSIAIGAVWVWIGSICVIACIELVLKKKAPRRMLQAEGLAKFIITELDHIEVYLAAVVVAGFMIGSNQPFASSNITFFIPLTLIFLQKFLSMPALGSRTESILRGSVVLRHLRMQAVVFDLVKIVSLLVFSFQLLTSA